jgi:hypothetical protein
MPMPTWLSRLELDLIRTQRKKGGKTYESARKRNKKQGASEGGKVEGKEERTEGKEGGADEGKVESTKQPVEGKEQAYPSMLQPEPVTFVPTLHDLYPAGPPPSDFSIPKKKKKLHPKLKELKGELPTEQSFERRHIKNARLGEILEPIRKARGNETFTHFGPKSPINKHVKKILTSTGKYKEAVLLSKSKDGSSKAIIDQALKEHPLPLSKDIVLSPKKWNVAHSNVEPVGWFNPFADRFPNQVNVGSGRDFTRVPGKFNNVSKEDREENFRMWLIEKKKAKHLQKLNKTNDQEDALRDSQGLTPSERRGDVALSQNVKALIEEKNKNAKEVR